jgi:hypothetical protein
MLRRYIAVSLATLLFALVPAQTAFAISSITNSLRVNSSGRYVSRGERTTWEAKTSYGQYLMQNPYTSDFECLISAAHFDRPKSYHRVGTSSRWQWVSYDSSVRGPAWRNYTGVMWVWQPRTVMNRFYAYGKRSGYTKGWKPNRLGQDAWSVSKGTPATTYTYHY